jgi:hypothetical protein
MNTIIWVVSPCSDWSPAMFENNVLPPSSGSKSRASKKYWTMDKAQKPINSESFYCCMCIFYRGNVSTEPLSSNDRGIFTEPLPSNDRVDIQTHTHNNVIS